MKRARTFLVRLLAALTAGLVVISAGALWLITTGPVSLGFLTPYFEDALVARDGAYRVTFADTVLAWGGWRRTLDLRVLDVRLVDAEGALLAQAPEISVTLSARALLRGVIAPTRVDLLSPQLRLIRNEDGRIGLGANFGELAPQGNMLPLLLAALSRPPAEGSPLDYLSSVGIAEATVWIEDRIAGAEWFAPRLDATASRRSAGVSAELDLILALDSGAVEFTATADYSDVPGILTFAAAFADLNPAAIAASAPALAAYGRVDTKVNGNVAALVTRDGTLSRLDFDLASGPGIIDSKTWNQPIAFDSLALRGTVLDSLRVLRVDDFFFVQSGFSGEGAGFFTFGPDGFGFNIDATWADAPADRLDALWPVELAPTTRQWVTTSVRGGYMPKGTLHLVARPEDFGHMPQRGEIDMTFTYADGAVTYLEGQPDLVQARGTAHLTNRTFDLTVETGKIGGLSIAEGEVHIDGVDTLVPSLVVDFVGSGPIGEGLRILSLPPMYLSTPTGLTGVMAARARIALPLHDHITAEQVKYAAAVNLRDLAVPSGMRSLALTNGSVSLRADSGGVQAQGTIAANGAPLTFDAQIPVRAGQPLQITARGNLNQDARRQLGFDLGAAMQGTIGAVARLELMPDATGAVSLRSATFDLELANAVVDLPGTNWDKAAAQPGNANLVLEPAPDGTLHFPAVTVRTPAFTAAGQFTVAPVASAAAGQATINGYQFDVHWTGGTGGAAGHLSASTQADTGLLAAFGYDLGPWLDGPLGIGIEVDTAGVEPGLTRVSLDLRDATISTPIFSKAGGRDGFAEIGLAPDANRAYRLRSFAITSAGLAASGTIDPALAADGSWQRIQLARLVLGETNVSATIERQPSGDLQVTAQGARLDARAFLAGTSGPATGAPQLPLPTIQLNGRFERVQVTDERALENVAARATLRNGTWASLDANGKLPSGGDVVVVIAEGAGGRDVTLTSTDAGGFFNAFGLFTGATGGTLEVNAKIEEDAQGRALAGTVRARNFHLVRSPAMIQLLSAASFIGLVEQMQGAGIPFADLEMPFRLNKGGFTLGESRASGASLGILFEGGLDRDRNQLNLSGTIVPAYMINNLLGRIPLIGDLIIGEGLLAFTYRVTGSPQQPVITVNPLSVLAPGILGRIFRAGP